MNGTISDMDKVRVEHLYFYYGEDPALMDVERCPSASGRSLR
jgi:hypothetical protein